ncbi:hypothetical protein J6590_042071 [Homalodisca vitripennis]|nr:hypothetical protein J6590_042071 [Homalodisca vitripennis]
MMTSEPEQRIPGDGRGVQLWKCIYCRFVYDNGMQMYGSEQLNSPGLRTGDCGLGTLLQKSCLSLADKGSQLGQSQRYKYISQKPFPCTVSLLQFRFIVAITSVAPGTHFNAIVVNNNDCSQGDHPLLNHSPSFPTHHRGGWQVRGSFIRKQKHHLNKVTIPWIDNRIKQRRAWMLLGWMTAELSCPCKQPAFPAVGGSSEVTLSRWSPGTNFCNTCQQAKRDDIVKTTILRNSGTGDCCQIKAPPSPIMPPPPSTPRYCSLKVLLTQEFKTSLKHNHSISSMGFILSNPHHAVGKDPAIKIYKFTMLLDYWAVQSDTYCERFIGPDTARLLPAS